MPLPRTTSRELVLANRREILGVREAMPGVDVPCTPHTSARCSPCCTASDYQDESAPDATRVIGIATEGLSFSPPCLTIKVGQTVRWESSLGAHPLAPGNPDDPNAGSAGNPIVETGSGQSVEFAFPAAGTFAYYCELHAFGNGQGMAGSVHVKP